MNTKKAAVKLSAAQTEALSKIPTTSGKIRYLAAEKLSRGDISRALDIRYQWVRNVLITPLKNG